MDVSNAHNLAREARSTERGSFGIRVSLPPGEPFARLLDEGWSTTHWYASRQARDAALADMRRRHPYSREGDAPTLVFEPVERDSAD